MSPEARTPGWVYDEKCRATATVVNPGDDQPGDVLPACEFTRDSRTCGSVFRVLGKEPVVRLAPKEKGPLSCLMLEMFFAADIPKTDDEF